jgi:hypothetical protein
MGGTASFSSRQRWAGEEQPGGGRWLQALTLEASSREDEEKGWLALILDRAVFVDAAEVARSRSGSRLGSGVGTNGTRVNIMGGVAREASCGRHRRIEIFYT